MCIRDRESPDVLDAGRQLGCRSRLRPVHLAVTTGVPLNVIVGGRLWSSPTVEVVDVGRGGRSAKCVVVPGDPVPHRVLTVAIIGDGLRGPDHHRGAAGPSHLSRGACLLYTSDAADDLTRV